MKNILKSLALAALVTCLAPSAMAQATRTWVSGVGDDANPCSRTAPCKTFAGAISKTATNGVISALDPGGFGAVTINKSITLDGAGTQASILAAGTNGINVTAAVSVKLRNLSIDGVDSGLVGINISGAGALVTIENCTIAGFRQGNASGIYASQPALIIMRDSSISDATYGVRLQPASGTTAATLDNVLITDTAQHAIYTTGNTWATIRRSTITQNLGYGVNAASSGSVINIVDSMLSYNFGLAAVSAGVSGSLVRISGNSMLNNAAALAVAGGATMESDGTNRIGGTSLAGPNATFTNQ